MPVALLAAMLLAAPPSDQPPATPASAARISADVKVLAGDAFEGRGPATRAEPRVIDYVTAQMKAAGLAPAGPGGAWTQDVPLARFELTGPIKLSMSIGGTSRTLLQGTDMVAMTELFTPHVSIKDAPLVFCGYGVKAPERGWDDFKGVDLKGKIAVVLVNDPDFETPAPGKFDGKAMTYYGRWTYKFEEAARQGALGLLIVHETGPASYGWNVVQTSNTIAQFDIVRDDPSKSHPVVQGWMQRSLALDLFKASGLDFEAQKKRAQTEGFTPVPLKATLSADYGVTATKIVSHNILGKLVGTKHPDEVVLYTGHWDHLGVGAPDVKGDTIYNGAIDNADGVAAVLELARLYAKAPRTDRSIVFMNVTAEEKGLLGSEYYASHPVYPLAKTVAMINIDALKATSPARNVSVSGDSKGELQDLLAAAAVKEGRRLTPDQEPGAGHFFRSDHFPMAKRGVPALSLESGQDLYAGGEAVGRAAEQDYTAHRYHQPSDEWTPGLDFSGEAVDVGLAYTLGRGLADSRQWPGWKPGSEFKAARDSSASERK